MGLKPAEAGTVHLSFGAKENAGEVKSVRQRAQVQAQPPEGPPLIFETLEGLDLIHIKLTDVQVFDGAAFTKVSELNNTQNSDFPPFRWIPQVASPLSPGLTPPHPQPPTPPHPP